MKIEMTGRGFERLMSESYPDGDERTLAQQSSAIDDNNTELSSPGSSYLWIGENHHLNRTKVRQLIKHMNNWLETGSLEMTVDRDSQTPCN